MSETMTDSNENIDPQPNLYQDLLEEARSIEAERAMPAPEVVAATVEKMANFSGNWMNLQKERMESASFRTKFARFKLDHIDADAVDDTDPMARIKNQPSQARRQVETYDDILVDVHSHVIYGNADQVLPGTKPTILGRGKLGGPGTVLRDAVSPEGEALSDRQKDIIAAHEAFHGVVSADSVSEKTVLAGFDLVEHNNIIEDRRKNGQTGRSNYFRNADELMARMAQLKNYYGMKDDEPFSAQHLAYAREHYVGDTGLDNSIGMMFRMVTPETEPVFLANMDRLPV